MRPALPETRRDANPLHTQAYRPAMTKAKKPYCEDERGERRLILQILATHPNYRRRGAATTLCKSGMELAAEQDLVISLFASPIGRELYKHLGFLTLGAAVVNVDGDFSERKLVFTVMEWEKADSEPGEMQ